jgi:MFS family permease
LTGKGEAEPGRSALVKEQTAIAGADPLVTAPIPLSFAKIGLIFGAGVGVSLGFRLFMATFSRILKQIEIPDVTVRVILGSLFLSMSLTSMPLGNLGMRLGTRRGMLVGLTLMAGFCSTIALISSPGLAMLVAISVGATFSLVSNATVPFALSLVPTERSGLGTAIYFSGGSIAATLLAGTLAKLQNLNPAVAALLGAGSFLLAGFFVAASQNDRSTPYS